MRHTLRRRETTATPQGDLLPSDLSPCRARAQEQTVELPRLHERPGALVHGAERIGEGERQVRCTEQHGGLGERPALQCSKAARTAVQVTANMRIHLRGDELGLVGYYPFDEKGGSTAIDGSPSANHGSLIGAGTGVPSDAPLCAAGARDASTDAPNYGRTAHVLNDAGDGGR